MSAPNRTVDYTNLDRLAVCQTLGLDINEVSKIVMDLESIEVTYVGRPAVDGPGVTHVTVRTLRMNR